MSNCKNCGINVGCGCNLTEGYCVTCYGLFKQGLIKFKKWIITLL